LLDSLNLSETREKSMVATISSPAHTATHGSLKRSISDYTAGQLSKQDISRLLAQALEIDPGCGPAIEAILDREFRGRRLSSADYKELTADLRTAPSENIPTETSEGVPDKSGLYRVDDEGTLILSSDFEPELPPPLLEPLLDDGSPMAPHDLVLADVPSQRNVAKPPALEVGSILRERFRLDEEVASGSMGLVYRATDLLKLEAGAMSPVVAVKVINPKFANDRAALKSFQNEVANTQHLSHPNIIHLFELDKHGDHFFMTMEWLEGESLDCLLDRSMGSALPPTQTYAIIEQLCDALAYAHARNVVHADIKPGNVFLTKPGELKLIDFGIAHFDDTENVGDAPHAEQQTVALTPAYASCEALEKLKPTAQDDLFSLACLVYRLLSGRRAFGSLTALQAEAKGVELVPIGGMTETRWQALAKALSFRRADRQPDVKSFAEEFGQRAVPRPYDLEPEIDDVAYTATMTLQALPEGVTDPTASIADQVAPAQIAAQETVQETAKVTTHASVPEIDFDIDEALFTDTAAMGSAPAGMEAGQPEPVEDAPLFVDTMALDELPVGADIAQPEDDSADLLFTETTSLGAPPENIEATTSDTVNLEETAPLGATSFRQGVDLLGTDVIGASPDTQPLDPASADTQDLGELPDPINFFDGDCDDSVFVPLDDSPSAATSADAATDQVEVLPGDCSFMDGRSAEPQTPVQKQAPLAQQPAKQAAPAPQVRKPPAQVPVKSSGPSEPEIGEQATVNTAAKRQSQIVAALTGVGQSTGAANRRLLTRVAKIAQAKPLHVGGAIAATVAVAAIGAVLLFGAGSSQSDIGVDQSAQLAAMNAVAVAQPAVPGVQTVVPTELFFTSGSDAKTIRPETPAYAADAGIAAGDSVVAVPLSLASQSANGAVPSAVNSKAEAVSNQPVAARPTGAETVTVGYMIGLHNLARQALAAGNLTEPTDASAMVWIDKMRTHEPNSKETLSVQAQLAAGLLQRAEQAVVSKNPAAAERWAGLADQYGADDAGLAKIQRSVAEVRRQLARQAAALAAETKTVQKETASPEADGLSVEIPVPLSEIEFTRYSEPVFPARLLNTTVAGWVDVGFTIGADGETSNIKVTGSDLPADFVAPSIAAVESWGFKPYIHNGEVVPVNSAVRLNYAN
jgi:serine/threonine protein kinase/outer membrane biosynthesis protein TonB